MCGGQMRLIAFITEGTKIEKILNHIGVESEPPHTFAARGCPDRAGLASGSATSPRLRGRLASQWVTGTNSDFESLRAASAPGIHSAPHLTLLNTKPWFEDVALWAAGHHESLKGYGYPFHL